MNKKKFLYNTSVVMMIFSLNKVLGFFRESLIADKYGASLETDAFYFALSIASLLFIVSGAFTQIIKPIVISIQEEKGIKEGERYFNSILNLVSFIILIACVLLAVFAKQVITLFGQGFSPDKIEITVTLFRISLVSIFSICLSTIYASYFDCRKMFISSAFDAYFFNFVTIAFLLLFATSENIVMFTYVYAFGEFFRIIYFNVILRKKDYKHQLLQVELQDENVRKTLKLALPLLVGNLSTIANRLVDRILASTLLEGSISSFNYADKLTSVFTGVILSAVLKVVFPSLTIASLTDKEEYRKKTSQVLNFTLFLIIPIVAAYIVYAKTMVIVIFEHGLFTRGNTMIVTEIVILYSISMLFVSLNVTMSKFLYINKQTKILFISGLIGFVVNITFNLLLVKTYQHQGLAFATLLAGFSRTIFLLYIMHFKNKTLIFKDNVTCLLKTVFATIIMAAGSFVVSLGVKDFMFAGKVLNELIGVGSIALIGIILYAGTLYLLKSEELNYFLPKKFKNLKG